MLTARRTSIVLITDAEMKALPTTTKTIVPAQGAGLLIIPHFTLLLFKSGATAYTNLDPNAYLNPQFAATASLQGSYLGTDASLTDIADLPAVLGSTGGVAWRFTYPYQNDRGAPSRWGALSYWFGSDVNANSAMELFAFNGGAGNFTGGNASNQFYAVTEYSVVKVP